MSDNEYVAVADISPKVGDYIVDTHGTQFRVDGIDYVNCTLDAITRGCERSTFPFSGFISGEYKKVDG